MRCQPVRRVQLGKARWDSRAKALSSRDLQTRPGRTGVVGPGTTEDLVNSAGSYCPSSQQCVCGERRATRVVGEIYAWSHFPCCDRTFQGGRIVAIGPVWLEAPLGPKDEPTPARLLELMSRTPPRPEGMTTALYRRADADDVLLYLGITDDLRERNRWHERHSPWAQFVATYTTEWFPSRALAEQAEVKAIGLECPLFNKQHAAPGRAQAAAEYLLKDRRFRLVAPTEMAQTQK